MSDIAQLSPEWFAQRAGKATASRIADIVAKTKTGYATSRANYAAQLIAERLTGVPAESYSNAIMARGIEVEPEARRAYALRSDNTVSEVGFIEHPAIPMAGASPDGTIDNAGLVEIKCPLTATHIDVLLGGNFPDKYVIQVQWQMACTGRQWCDLVSYDNRLPEAMRLFILRIERDDARIAVLESEVRTFLAEVDKKVRALTERYA